MSDIAKAIEIYETFLKTLSDYNFRIAEYKTINYGLQFTIQQNNWSGIIRIYQNKKGIVKVDYSQLDKSQNSIFVEELLEGRISDTTFSKSKTLDTRIVQNNNNLPIIGTDESGKGDYFVL